MSTADKLQAMTSEQFHAVMQGHCIAAMDAYFEARPRLARTRQQETLFEAGYYRAFEQAAKLARGE